MRDTCSWKGQLKKKLEMGYFYVGNSEMKLETFEVGKLAPKLESKTEVGKWLMKLASAAKLFNSSEIFQLQKEFSNFKRNFPTSFDSF